MITQKINADDLIKNLMSTEWSTRTRALSKIITIIENSPDCAKNLLDKILSTKPIQCEISDGKFKSHIFGLTGLPGSGKSTVINGVIKKWRAQNHSVAVLAIDPSSVTTGGAVLGDRIRMREHFQDPMVFIRSMGARGALGGVAKSTHPVLALLKWFGFNKIIVETVGTGQSESDVMQEADTVGLVLLPNVGDAIQFMKAGIMQLAHIFVLNKTDLADPSRTMQELEEIELHQDGWKPVVVCTSATNNLGLDELLLAIEQHQKHLDIKKHDTTKSP